MPELLDGTVTFLFSDIEGSTRLLQAHPAVWPSILERHREIVRKRIADHQGREVGTEGDSFFVGFPTAPGAVAAAVEIQRALADEPWPDGVELRVRIGLHTGDASLATDSYVGLNVHRASRIASAGHGGQVLLSHVTRTLVGEDLPPDTELRDLGEHRLRDLEQPERLWQLVTEGLQDEFPPIRTLDTPNNLPTRLTTFLGREREIGQVLELLGRSRLLTLTGPGGTGKTRLSIEVAQRSMENSPDGVFFVPLAPIRDPELVTPTIAQTLGLPDRGGRRSLDRLSDHIGERRMLLVLDNFEQVTDAARDLAGLLETCPHLTVLVSSRAILHVSGEQEYPVPPLGVPDVTRLPPIEQLSQYEAVALFIERSRAVKPDFNVTNENAPAVAEICVRLDGLPLAIELAAARIRILTPQAMLTRLENRLRLLAGGSQDLPERQQTLRGAIAWSHDLLEPTDRALFAGLSVFVGGASLEAVDEVCGDIVPGDVFDALTSLVAKSLVRQTDGVNGQPRFVMLETIREFAREQADERSVWEALGERHAAHFGALADTMAPQVMGSGTRGSLDRLEEEHDNLRAAFTWAVDHEAAESALRMSAALWRFWQMRGYLREGLERVQRALGLTHARQHPVLRAAALSAAAGLAYWLADTDLARALYTEEIEARRALDDRAGLAYALYGISFTWSITDYRDPETVQQATAAIQEALGIFRELGDEAGIGRCEWALANVAWGQQGDGSREHGLRALAVFERLNDAFMIAWCSYTLGLSHMTDGSEATGDAAARPYFERALRIFADAEDVTGYALLLDAFAILAFRAGDRARAARISGSVARIERTSGTGLNFWNRNILGFEPETLRVDPVVSSEWAAGEAADLVDAVAYALGNATV